jgi:hypothetical protein
MSKPNRTVTTLHLNRLRRISPILAETRRRRPPSATGHATAIRNARQAEVPRSTDSPGHDRAELLDSDGRVNGMPGKLDHRQIRMIQHGGAARQIRRLRTAETVTTELMSLRRFVLRQLGYAADSLAAGEHALALFTELEQTAPDMLSAVGHVPILLNRGAALADLGRATESLVPLARALDAVRAAGAAHREVEIELLVLQGTSLTVLGRFAEAEVLLAQGRRRDAARYARLAEPILRECAEEVPLLVAGSLATCACSSERQRTTWPTRTRRSSA